MLGALGGARPVPAELRGLTRLQEAEQERGEEVRALERWQVGDAADQLEVRRDSLFGGGNPRAAQAAEQLMAETPLEIAGLYLARQDLDSTITYAEALKFALLRR